MTEQQKQISTQPPAQREGSLQIHARQVAPPDFVIAQIDIDTLVERFLEIAMLGEPETPDGSFYNNIYRSGQIGSPPTFGCENVFLSKMNICLVIPYIEEKLHFLPKSS